MLGDSKVICVLKKSLPAGSQQVTDRNFLFAPLLVTFVYRRQPALLDTTSVLNKSQC